MIYLYGNARTHTHTQKPNNPTDGYWSLESRHCVPAHLLILKATGGFSMSMFLCLSTAFSFQAASVRAKAEDIISLDYRRKKEDTINTKKYSNGGLPSRKIQYNQAVPHRYSLFVCMVYRFFPPAVRALYGISSA